MQWSVQIFTIPSYFFPPTPSLGNFLIALGFSADSPWGRMLPSGYAPYVKAGIVNSIIVAIPVTLATMAVAMPSGYVFGRMSFPHKNKLFFALLFSRTVPPVSVAVPYYFFYVVTGLIGTYLGLILIYLSITVPFITWVLMGFFSTLPTDIERAARIDGCSRFQAFSRVVVPMASAAVATCAGLAFLLSWNEFFFSLLLSTGTPVETLPAAVAGMLMLVPEFNVLAAANVLALIPAVIAAIFLQRYIVRLRLVDPVTMGVT